MGSKDADLQLLCQDVHASHSGLDVMLLDIGVAKKQLTDKYKHGIEPGCFHLTCNYYEKIKGTTFKSNLQTHR